MRLISWREQKAWSERACRLRDEFLANRTQQQQIQPKKEK
jgi:hypothetical protein